MPHDARALLQLTWRPTNRIKSPEALCGINDRQHLNLRGPGRMGERGSGSTREKGMGGGGGCPSRSISHVRSKVVVDFMSSVRVVERGGVCSVRRLNVVICRVEPQGRTIVIVAIVDRGGGQ